LEISMSNMIIIQFITQGANVEKKGASNVYEKKLDSPKRAYSLV